LAFLISFVVPVNINGKHGRTIRGSALVHIIEYVDKAYDTGEEVITVLIQLRQLWFDTRFFRIIPAFFLYWHPVSIFIEMFETNAVLSKHKK